MKNLIYIIWGICFLIIGNLNAQTISVGDIKIKQQGDVVIRASEGFENKDIQIQPVSIDVPVVDGITAQPQIGVQPIVDFGSITDTVIADDSAITALFTNQYKDASVEILEQRLIQVQRELENLMSDGNMVNPGHLRKLESEGAVLNQLIEKAKVSQGSETIVSPAETGQPAVEMVRPAVETVQPTVETVQPAVETVQPAVETVPEGATLPIEAK